MTTTSHAPQALPVPLLFKGAPGSPYTRKMLAVLRYRGIPYRLMVGSHEAIQNLPQPRVSLMPTFYLPNHAGELEAVVDSTPLLRRFEAAFRGRAVVPDDPVVAFVDYLLEDYADEWLTKAMFHYRWHFAADIEQAGEILPRWRGVSAPEGEMKRQKQFIQDRQISRLWVVGSNPVTAPVIEASYQRFLDLFRAVLESQPFLLGERPSACDFAVYGQLTQLARFDPTPMALTLAKAPRVFAWVDVVDDLSGLEVSSDGWIGRDRIAERVGPLLAEVGRVYVPFLVANGRALATGAERVVATIDGSPWEQQPFPYQGKCLQWLRASYADLGSVDRAAVDAILAGTGCEALFAGHPS